MPAWSPEIANEFIRLAAGDGRALDQLQLQACVYLAHGWRLAFSGEPLTGDRPEAWEFGPMYRRLADALSAFGDELVTRQIANPTHVTGMDWITSGVPPSDLDQSEMNLIADVYKHCGGLESWQLSAVTRKGASPWRQVFADGAGKGRDIPHKLIRAQFVELLEQTEGWQEGG